MAQSQTVVRVKDVVTTINASGKTVSSVTSVGHGRVLIIYTT